MSKCCRAGLRSNPAGRPNRTSRPSSGASTRSMLKVRGSSPRSSWQGSRPGWRPSAGRTRRRDTIERALAECEKTDQGWCDAELWRVRGELLLASPQQDRAQVSRSFERALSDCPRSWRQALGAARRGKPGAAVGGPRGVRQGTRAAGSDLRLVHRGLRRGRSCRSTGPVEHVTAAGIARRMIRTDEEELAMKRLLWMCVLATAALALAGSAGAQTLRWASQGDPQTMDPHSQNETMTNLMNGQVYERLVVARQAARPRARAGHRVDSRSSPLAWRFKLRPNVKFHDGTPSPPTTSCSRSQRAQGAHLAASPSTPPALGTPQEDRRPHRRVHLTQRQPHLPAAPEH